MTKYHMHKREREITDPEIIEDVIINGKFLTLALCRNNEPYILTLNYGYDKTTRSLYFHSAKEGLKLAFIEHNPKVCGTIIEDHGYIEKRCSHAYRSVVFNGSIHRLEKADDKRYGLNVMLEFLENEPSVIQQRLIGRGETYGNIEILRLDIEEITGKAGDIG